MPLTLLFGLSDIGRLFLPAFGRFYNTYFGFLLRSHEQNDRGRRLNGATYVLFSATLLVLFFPKVIAITAIAVLDRLRHERGAHRQAVREAPVPEQEPGRGGRVLHQRAPCRGVRPEGRIHRPGIRASAPPPRCSAPWSRQSAIGLDDNLSIPLTVGGVMWVLYLVFLPALNLFKLDGIV